VPVLLFLGAELLCGRFPQQQNLWYQACPARLLIDNSFVNRLMILHQLQEVSSTKQDPCKTQIIFQYA
jgi:hypothetical protein